MFNPDVRVCVALSAFYLLAGGKSEFPVATAMERMRVPSTLNSSTLHPDQ